MNSPDGYMNDLLFRPLEIEKSRIPERIVEAFKEKIYTRELLPGDPLPSERELCNLFGVGRSSIREALKALMCMGFIEAKQGNGYFMKDTASLVSDYWTNFCLFNHIPTDEYVDARSALESEIVRLATFRASPEEVENMRSLAMQFSQAVPDYEKMIEIDCELHLTIARSTKNRVLLEMLNTTRKLMSEYILHVLKAPGRIERGIREHMQIVEAIERKESSKAVEIMRIHVGKSGDVRC